MFTKAIVKGLSLLTIAVSMTAQAKTTKVNNKNDKLIIHSYRIYESTEKYPEHNFYNQLLDCAAVSDSNSNSIFQGTDNSSQNQPTMPALPGIVIGNTNGSGSSLNGNNTIIHDPGINGTGGASNNSGTGVIVLDPNAKGNMQNGYNQLNGYGSGSGSTPGSINYTPGVDPTDHKITLEKIVNIGNLIWNIVDMGRVNTYLQTYRAHALPKGISCWSDLENWQIPVSKVFTVEYKNLVGQVVANYSYRISYIYGGSVNGIGKYIANLTVSPVDLRVKWGFNFSSEVQIPAPFNLGSRQNPVAAMQVFVYWSIGNALKSEQRSSLYFVAGDGRIQQTESK